MVVKNQASLLFSFLIFIDVITDTTFKPTLETIILSDIECLVLVHCDIGLKDSEKYLI